MRVGDVVMVGTRFVMGDRVGQGRQESDSLTGTVWRIVRLRDAGKYCPASAELAPADLLNVDESDAVWDVSLTRLSLVTP